MKVALATYPIAFQAKGGLEVQITETLLALRAIGIEAKLFDMLSHKFTDFDLVHVFAAIHGNHQIVETAKHYGVSVVLSSVLHPPFSKWQGIKGRLCETLTGCLTNWAVSTSYAFIRSALDGSDRIVALGAVEKQLLRTGYGIGEAKIHIIPNGISRKFYDANPDVFLRRYNTRRKLILCVAYISPYKNQLGVIRALQNEPCDIVLIGECEPANRTYLNDCLSMGGDKVRYLGAMDHDDPMLSSAYAAADIMVLASRTEVAPLAVLESLATGTPVIVTRNNSLDLEMDGEVLVSVDPSNTSQIRDNVLRILEQPPMPARCSALVEPLTWRAVANNLLEVYSNLHMNTHD